jgi:hypothetical protein
MSSLPHRHKTAPGSGLANHHAGKQTRVRSCKSPCKQEIFISGSLPFAPGAKNNAFQPLTRLDWRRLRGSGKALPTMGQTILSRSKRLSFFQNSNKTPNIARVKLFLLGDSARMRVPDKNPGTGVS